MAWTQLTNNAKTTLSAGCTDVATAITPTAKTTFPDPEDDGSFYATIWDADTYPDPGDDPGMEIVLVTADAAANWTVTRGQAGTAGAAHVAGDAVRLLWLAEHAQEIQDAIDLNSTHRTTVDAISGLVSGNGAGGYSGVARANLTGTANQVTLTGDGSNTLLGTAIQLSLPQDIATASTPQFGRLGLGAAAGTARITLVEGTTAADGIDFGGDATLYRSAANVLSTDDSLSVALGAVINEGGGDYDTRIEGDTDANLIYVDAGNNRVGIGTATPAAKLSLAEGTTAADGIAFGGDVNLYRSAADILKTDDALQVARVGLGQAPAAGTTLGLTETFTTPDDDGNCVDVLAILAPSGALSTTTRIRALRGDAQWNSAVDGGTYGTVYGMEGLAKTLSTGSGNLRRASGVRAAVTHYGSGAIGQAEVVYSLLNNNDEANETGDITVGYNYLAVCATDKGTGVIGTRYGYYVADVIGGGVCGTQYGIYVAALSGATTNVAAYLGGDVQIAGGLDVASTTQAFLPPRMTTAQRDAIGSPAAGMVVYNTTTNVLNFYNGSTWGAV